MIVHLGELWLSLAAAFLGGCAAGALLHWLVGRSALAPRQTLAADSIAALLDRWGFRLPIVQLPAIPLPALPRIRLPSLPRPAWIGAGATVSGEPDGSEAGAGGRGAAAGLLLRLGSLVGRRDSVAAGLARLEALSSAPSATSQGAGEPASAAASAASGEPVPEALVPLAPAPDAPEPAVAEAGAPPEPDSAEAHSAEPVPSPPDAPVLEAADAPTAPAAEGAAAALADESKPPPVDAAPLPAAEADGPVTRQTASTTGEGGEGVAATAGTQEGASDPAEPAGAGTAEAGAGEVAATAAEAEAAEAGAVETLAAAAEAAETLAVETDAAKEQVGDPLLLPSTVVVAVVAAVEAPEPEAAPLPPEDLAAPGPGLPAEPAAIPPSVDSAHGPPPPPVRPPTLTGPRNGVADDLGRISGIDPSTAERLADLGIHHFDQIAAWTPGEARFVAGQLSLGNRIEREGWVAQAAALAPSEDARDPPA